MTSEALVSSTLYHQGDRGNDDDDDEATKKEIEARAYQLWEKATNPKAGKMNFGTWLNKEDKSSPTRIPDTL
jgi:hypothetical protein